MSNGDNTPAVANFPLLDQPGDSPDHSASAVSLPSLPSATLQPVPTQEPFPTSVPLAISSASPQITPFAIEPEASAIFGLDFRHRDDLDDSVLSDDGAIPKPSILPRGACRGCKILKMRCEYPDDGETCKRCAYTGKECIVPVPKHRRPLRVKSDKRKERVYSPACTRCKILKVRCDFFDDTNPIPCKRCLDGGHNCVVEKRRPRSSSSFSDEIVDHGRHVYQVKGNERPQSQPRPRPIDQSAVTFETEMILSPSSQA